MKLKYIIPSFMAVIAAVFTSCSENNDPTLLDSIQVSTSYLGIGQDGGKVSTILTANSDWAFASQKWIMGKDTITAATPQWLTVNQVSGPAGKTELTFSADKADESRECELHINCGGEMQRIMVVQQAEETDPVVLTVSEAVALIKSGQQGERAVHVKGIVCRIQEISTQYGNATYFLSDDGTFGDGNWLEVYRGYWINGAKFTQGDEFAVGDELLISGVLIDYNGTPETNQGTCEVISIKKSLIAIGGVEMLNTEDGEGLTVFPMEGGQAKITVNSKGDGFHISIPDDAKSWLHIADFGPNYVTLQADANTGGDRSVTVGLSTMASGTTYSCQQSFTQKGAIVECSIADFLAAPVGDTQYRITGIITSVAKAEYGNVYLRDFSGEVYVYGIGAKGEFESLGLKEGDIVTLVGKRAAYKDSPQMGGGQYEKHFSVKPVTVAEFNAAPDAPDVYYMLTGSITKVVNATYGNLNLADETGETYIYGCYPGWGATGDFRKGFLETAGIEEGDVLTVIGSKTTYNGTIEMNGGLYFSHEKAK